MVVWFLFPVLLLAAQRKGTGHNVMDLDQWLEKVKSGNYLLEDELKQLCEYVSAETLLGVRYLWSVGVVMST